MSEDKNGIYVLMLVVIASSSGAVGEFWGFGYGLLTLSVWASVCLLAFLWKETRR